MSASKEPAALVYMTVGSKDEARSLGRALVEARLVACANLLPPVTSIYEWEGELRESAEFVVLLKTRLSLVEALKQRLVAMHSYECPCVLVLPVTDGHAPFLDWVVEQTDHEA